MKNINKFFSFAFPIILSIPCFGGDTVKVRQSGFHELKLSATKECLVVCSLRVDTIKTAMLNSGMWGTWNDQSPKTIVADIKLMVNKKKIGFPLSSYSDLANPKYAMLITTGGGYRLIIRGGDDGNPYKATIDFDEKRVVMRKIQWMICPDEAWEMTIYSPPVIID